MNQFWRPIFWPAACFIVGLITVNLLDPRSWQSERDVDTTRSSTSPPTVTAAIGLTPLPVNSHPRHLQVAATRTQAASLRGTISTPTKLAGHETVVAMSSDVTAPETKIEPPAAAEPDLDMSINVTNHDDVTESPRTPITPPGSAPDDSQVAGDSPDRSDSLLSAGPRDDVRQVTNVWPLPVRLVQQLKELSDAPEVQPWAEQTLAELERLQTIPELSADESVKSLARLRQLAGEAAKQAMQVKTANLVAELRRAEYALVRRLEIWEPVQRAAAQPESFPVSLEDTSAAIRRPLDAASAELRRLPGGQSWRDYLLLDLVNQAARDPAAQDEARRRLARRVLLRIESSELSEKQRSYFDQPVFAELRLQLRRWAYQPIELASMLSELEQYESEGSTRDARSLAQAIQLLRWADRADLNQLGEQLDTHYRNANFRVSVSGELINRLLPPPQRYTESIQDQIRGAQVYGDSEVENHLFVRLLPDGNRLRMGIEARGVGAAATEAYKGPVMFQNEGLFHFNARKMLSIDRRGTRVWRAEAEANSDNYVTGIESDYDSIPLLGSLVRSIAMKQQEGQACEVRNEVDARVAGTASQRLDTEVQARLEIAEREFKARVLDPLQRLKLDPIPIGMETTDERLIVRYRLAGSSQMGAHTSRPQALSNSLLSTQIHQSALNNLVEQLGLDGREIALTDLYREIVQKLNLTGIETPDDIPAGVTVKFAEHDSIRLWCEGGMIGLTLKVAELSAGHGHHWRNFAIRVHYVPVMDGIDARVIRDPEGIIELAGQRLRLRDQIALRGIFSKTFPPGQSFSVMPEKIKQDTRLKNLHVSQFVVSDGWIGLALAPDLLVDAQEPATAHNARRLFRAKN